MKSLIESFGSIIAATGSFVSIVGSTTDIDIIKQIGIYTCAFGIVMNGAAQLHKSFKKPSTDLQLPQALRPIQIQVNL